MAYQIFNQYRLISLFVCLLLIGCGEPAAPPANTAPSATVAVPENISLDAAAPENLKGELLDFTASWCGYCKQMAPVIAELKQQGYPIRTIDTDDNSDLADKFGVRGLPAFVYLVDDKEQERITGATSKRKLIELWQ